MLFMNEKLNIDNGELLMMYYSNKIGIGMGRCEDILRVRNAVKLPGNRT